MSKLFQVQGARFEKNEDGSVFVGAQTASGVVVVAHIQPDVWSEMVAAMAHGDVSAIMENHWPHEARSLHEQSLADLEVEAQAKEAEAQSAAALKKANDLRAGVSRKLVGGKKGNKKAK